MIIPHIGGSEIDEVFVVQGETHRIEAPRLDLVDVGLGDVVGQPRIVESLHAVGAHQGCQLLLPRVLGGGLAFGIHDVPLHHHPVTHVDGV